MPELDDVNTDQQDKGLQTSLVIDRDAASRLGVTRAPIDTTLNDAFGQRQVSTIYNALNQYQVVMEAAPSTGRARTTLDDIYVHRRSGGTVPLSSVRALRDHEHAAARSTTRASSPRRRSRSTCPRASRCRRPPTAIDDTMARIGVPSTIHGSFQGTAQAFQESLANQPFLILAALLAVYIVLGMLYESYVHPLTILSTLPSAGVGALLALLAAGTEFSDHRADRRDPADRHRQEERDHDDRLRARSASARAA